MSEMTNSLLGSYLKDRRARLDPTALGFAAGRRRTPGLRREEVAQRANISPTWYTWLEQGRGGSPSTDVLNRIAAGLMMTEPEREHLFMLAFGHPPEVFYKRPSEINPRLQRLIDAMVTRPCDHQDSHMGCCGMEPGRRNCADRLQHSAAGRSQYSQTDLLQFRHQGQTGWLGRGGPLCSGGISRRCDTCWSGIGGC
jgi:transcriptional regulator with XRE-family HTH domain